MENQITLAVSKETYELGQGLAAFVEACRVALEDGFQYGDDIPDIISSAISDLLPCVDNLDDISAEYKANPEIFIQTVSLVGLDIVKALGVFHGSSFNQ